MWHITEKDQGEHKAYCYRQHINQDAVKQDEVPEF